MLVITSEYSTGSIRSTVQWVPLRRRVVLAKTAIVAPVAFVTGCLLAIVGTLVAASLLGEWGEYDTGAVVADVLSIGLYLALASVFTVGIGAVVRSAVGTLTTVFMLLTLLPLSLSTAGGELAAKVGAVLPGGAGINFLNDVTDPFSPAASVGILAGWTGFWGAAADLRSGDQSIHPRHPDVEQDNIRAMQLYRLHRLPTVSCLGHHLDLALGGQDRAHAGPDHLLVVVQQHPDHQGALSSAATLPDWMTPFDASFLSTKHNR